MLTDLLIRFLVGGIVVSTFSLIGDLFKPKSFAGLFSAAPSIALATLGLAFSEHGASYASIEGKSMMVGAVAFFLYSQFVSWLLLRHKLGAVMVSTASLLVWFISAYALWFVLLK
jgi:hypothetical protein